jgi:hypothetical protein
MIYKLTTIHQIIGKVVRDLDLSDKEVPWQDMIEWIAEGLEHIGSYYQFAEKEAIIVIEDHKGVLPCDFHKSIKFLQGCDVGGLANSVPLWGLLNNALDCCDWRTTNPEGTVEEGDCMQIVDALSFQKLQLAQHSQATYATSFYNHLPNSQNLMDQGLTYSGANGNAYRVNFDTVTAAFRYGFISLRYLAIPVDTVGYPLVPDDVSFRDALMWKCAYQLSLRGHQFKNPQLQDFETCKFYWNQYCIQARAEANAPDPDQMERLARIFNTLSVDYHQYYDDFRNLGAPEHLNFDGIS